MEPPPRIELGPARYEGAARPLSYEGISSRSRNRTYGSHINSVTSVPTHKSWNRRRRVAAFWLAGEPAALRAPARPVELSKMRHFEFRIDTVPLSEAPPCCERSGRCGRNRTVADGLRIHCSTLELHTLRYTSAEWVRRESNPRLPT